MLALSIHRYPKASLLMDGLRSAFGLAVSFGPLLFFDVAWPLAILLLVMGGIFLLFTFRLIEQYRSSIELTDDGIRLLGAKKPMLRWPDLASLKLAHYSTPRRSSIGWYQLSLHTEGGSLKIDSTIERFGKIVAMANMAARERALVLDPATLENLKTFKAALGERRRLQRTDISKGSKSEL
jgi:hypothetical protein